MPVTAPSWSSAAIAHLRDRHACPVCGLSPLTDVVCRRCGADLASSAAGALWEASLSVAAALDAREGLRAGIPRRPVGALAYEPDSRDSASAAQAAPEPLALAPTRRARPDTTLQSVLAVAGAGLFAVAAIVFTFFNPDVSDGLVRATVTLSLTVAFVIGARQLSVRGLRASSETVGALAMVLVGLDVYAVAGFASSGISPWVYAGIGTLVAMSCMLTLAQWWRIRAWAGPGLVGLALVPAMLGSADPTAGGVPAAAGWVATMALGVALVIGAERGGLRLGYRLRAEITALTVVQLFAGVAAVMQVARGALEAGQQPFWVASGVLTAIALVARLATGLRALRTAESGIWALVWGAAAAAAAVAALLGVVDAVGSDDWWPAAMATGPLIGLIIATLIWPPRQSLASWTTAGALIVAVAFAMPVLSYAALGALRTLVRVAPPTPADVTANIAAATGLCLAAASLAAHGSLERRAGSSGWATVLAAWAWIGAASAVTTVPHGTAWMNAAAGVALSAATAVHLLRRRGIATVRVPLSLAAHTTLVLAAAVSWRSAELAIGTAPFIVAVALLLGATQQPRVRWVHVGASYAYGLVAVATAIELTGAGPIASVSVTTTVAALVAMAATFAPRVTARTWWTVLGVTFVPFVLGIAQVLTERSGWTALSTFVIFVLALALVGTRRPGMGIALRAVCSAVLVPALAVVTICLGAQVLSVSASPVTLPVIAVITAAGLSISAPGRGLLVRRGIPGRQITAVDGAFQASALVTGALAVVVSFAREAAGMPTAIVVLVILAVGSGVAAMAGRRTHLWWYSAASATGALWTSWRILGIDVVEAYALPPALAAAAVGVVLEALRRDGRTLVASGLSCAVAPSVVALAIDGGGARFAGLVVSATALAAVALALPGRSAIARLRAPSASAALVASAAGPVQAARLGSGLDPSGSFGPFAASLAPSIVGALLAIVAGIALARVVEPASRVARSRWLLAPAVAWLAAGSWTSVRRDWPTIWGLWALMAVLLVLVVAIAWRRRSADGILPPVWFVFGLAFVTAIVAWSPRDLRVEWFSLPLGAALLIAGALHLHASLPEGTAGKASLGAWPRGPRGSRGSWALLGPGIAVMMSASIVATFTDPLTWRAILVIAMALVAILIGARARLAAPFVLGVVVLPIENVSAFAVQIGRGIDSMPWWITLAAVGAVLLILAVSYEQREGEPGSLVARVRDLA